MTVLQEYFKAGGGESTLPRAPGAPLPVAVAATVTVDERGSCPGAAVLTAAAVGQPTLELVGCGRDQQRAVAVVDYSQISQIQNPTPRPSFSPSAASIKKKKVRL